MQEEQNNQSPTEQPGSVISPTGAVKQAQPPAPPAANSSNQPPAQASDPAQPPANNSTPNAEQSPITPEPTMEDSDDADDGINDQPESASDDEQTDYDMQNQVDDQDEQEDLDSQDTSQPVAKHQPISWQGSEYIHNQKTTNWFILLFIIAAAISGAVFLITRDFITVGMILFCAFIFGIFSRREPGQIQYAVSDDGITIGNKSFSYKQFKSFVVSQEGAIENIVLRPAKRFETLRTIYCSPEQIEDIVEVISSHIPLDEHSPDAVDKLMHKIRF